MNSSVVWSDELRNCFGPGASLLLFDKSRETGLSLHHPSLLLLSSLASMCLAPLSPFWPCQARLWEHDHWGMLSRTRSRLVPMGTDRCVLTCKDAEGVFTWAGKGTHVLACFCPCVIIRCLSLGGYKYGHHIKDLGANS